ncbi:hypothetical protein ACP70R_024925 [Stipagrostis hirtigluma subsp. patula]
MASASFPRRRRRLLVLLLVVALLNNAAPAAEAVPAVYVLGDSLADVGNNNYQLTLLRADFPPNGIDYPGRKATGRFSNGKNFADFLAEHLNLAPSPPFLAIRDCSNDGAVYANGVNFASGGAGVSSLTNMGQCISFDKQIEYYSEVHASLVKQLGYTGAQDHLARSIFAINIGSNDILDYVQQTSAAVSRARYPTHEQFIRSLLHSLIGQLQALYNLGARKFLFVGAGPIGCCPVLRLQSPSKDCDEEANELSVRYNTAVASLLHDMSARRSDMSYSFFDTFRALLPFIEQPGNYGFDEVKAACCGLGDLNAVVPCTVVSSYCADRRRYVFWDFAHPTEATVKKLLDIGLDGSAPFVYPRNIRRLIAV